MEKTGKPLKVWTWIFIVLTIVTPLFAIGSIICSIKYKNMMKLKALNYYNFNNCSSYYFVLNLLTLFGLR